VIGQIGPGLVLFVGLSPQDGSAEIDWLVRKVLDLRLFPAAAGGDRWELSVRERGGEILVVSQFTLYGDCRKGRRPSFDQAAPPVQAEALYKQFVERLQAACDLKIATGRFGAMMQVSLQNDGPVSLWLERDAS
jgi:D-tyrosyl-tRNA(Tyr) deacylase